MMIVYIVTVCLLLTICIEVPHVVVYSIEICIIYGWSSVLMVLLHYYIHPHMCGVYQIVSHSVPRLHCE